MLDSILQYLAPGGYILIFGLFMKFIYDKVKNGELHFEIKAKTFEQLEDENKKLKDENRSLQIKADIAMESWSEIAKRELCEECDKKEEK